MVNQKSNHKIITTEDNKPCPVKVINERGNFLIVLPHAGDKIPNYIMENILKVPRHDKFSFEVFNALKEYGGIVISSDIHRCVVDLNRARDDDSERGVIASISYSNNQVFKKDYTAEEREMILRGYYDPFHTTLEKYVNKLKNRNKDVFILAGHSFLAIGNKLSPDPGKKRADFCIGTLDDTLANAEYISLFEGKLRERSAQHGLTVTKNYPYKGKGFISKKYGRPDEGIHLIQLEVNMGSCNNPSGIKKVQDTICYAVNHLMNEIN